MVTLHGQFGIIVCIINTITIQKRQLKAALLLDMDYPTNCRQWDNHVLNTNVVLKPVQVDTVKIDCKLPVESLNG